MPQQQTRETIAKIGPPVHGIFQGQYSGRSAGIPVTNAQGKIEYFRNVPLDLLRHLGVIIKE